VYVEGQLVWIVASDSSGPIRGHPPVLILRRYVAIPMAFPSNEEANRLFVDEYSPRVVYDLMCRGVIERCVDEDWISNFCPLDVEFHLGGE
jgi:hypothetical protein